ncbi:MAG: hypothetical protein MI784_02845 [Cytophagales bacterium]|nr:hypothetical protein [Cytophagales bacterium]
MRRLFILSSIFLLLFFTHALPGADKNSQFGGLRFRSRYHSIEERTQLDLTRQSPFICQNNFRLTFDLAIARHSVFGYIFRLRHISQHTLELIFHPSLPESPNAFLKVILNGRQILAKLAVPKNKLADARWHTFDINLNLTDKLIRLSFLNDSLQHHLSGMPRQAKEWQLVFGSAPGLQPPITDIPCFSIRNVRVCTDEKNNFRWPLNESMGNRAIDLKQGRLAYIKHPQWLSPNHYYWEKAGSLKTHTRSGVAYDVDSNLFWIVEKDRLRAFDPNTAQTRKVSLNHSQPFLPNKKIRAFYSAHSQKLKAYQPEAGRIRTFDFHRSRWSAFDKEQKYRNEYQHHNLVFDPVSRNYYALSGYGYYTYKNHLRQYDSLAHSWSRIPYENRSLYPRYLSGTGHLKDSEFLVFGGRGNEEGLQELHVRNFMDLHLLDLAAKKAKLLWKDSLNSHHLAPVRSLIPFEKQNQFYALLYNPEKENTHLRLYQISLKTPEIQAVSDTIPYIFKDVLSDADLFYDSQNQRLFAYTQHRLTNDSSLLNIYSLRFPPGLACLQPVAQSSIFKDWTALLILSVWGLASLGAMCFLLLKMISSVSERSDSPDMENKDETLPRQPAANCLRIFGPFQAFDSSGNDIAKLFTPKLKETFMMILINEVYYQKGLTSDKLIEHLWPFSPREKAQNTRSIAIKRIRTILENIDGLSLVFEDNMWSLKISKPFPAISSTSAKS